MDIKDVEAFWNNLPSYDKLTFEESVALTEMIDNLILEHKDLRARVSALTVEVAEAVKIISTATEDLGFPTRQQMRIRTAAAEYRAEAAEAAHDTWQAAHDAIYAELQEVKGERDQLRSEADRTRNDLGDKIRALPLKVD